MALVRFLCLLGLCALVGCSPAPPALTPVSGTITLEQKPLTGAQVKFIPDGETKGHGGNGKTDENGKYEIVANRQNNRKGLLPGAYRVMVTRPLRPDGTPPPPDVPQFESGASESVPAPYSNGNDTPLKAIVDVNAKSYDFSLSKK